MQSNEHIFAVIEPNEAGDTSLGIATDLVASGGKATLVLLLNKQVRDQFRQFADSEDLDVHIGEAVALNRLVEAYTSRVGGQDTLAIVADSSSSARDLLDAAAETHATSIVIPQQLAARRNLRKLVSDAHIPVLVTPAA